LTSSPQPLEPQQLAQPGNPSASSRDEYDENWWLMLKIH